MISRNQWQDQWGIGGGGVEDEGEAEEVRRWGGAERRVGRGLKEKRPMMMMMTMGPKKFQQENPHPKNGRLVMYRRTAL